ncbi:MAG: phage portal protein [Planctomycetales bacterium]
MTATDTLAAELSQLRAAHEAARLRLEIRRMQGAAGLPLREEWGEVVTGGGGPLDFPDPVASDGALPASLDDRCEGRLRPVYETEYDLARLRGEARRLVSITAVAAGALEALGNYVLGGGFTFTARSRFEQPRLVTAAQRVIDEFLDVNDFSGGLDRELHHRSREDGEAFVSLVQRPGEPLRARVLEPEQVTEPADPRPIEEWLGEDEEGGESWTFGVRTRHGAPDIPLGYHVVQDSLGRDWDYLPAAQVEHLKRNVPRSAKRGVSDFYPLRGDLEREAKLRRNAAESAAIQAAIAWIIQSPAGSSIDDVVRRTRRDGLTGMYTAPVANTAAGNALRYPPGTILQPSAGLEYKPGPMGSDRNPDFVVIAQYLLRSIGVRWNMPEYMISADASNGNYASALVAESPFVKAREADQRFYRRHWHSLIWKVLQHAWRAGRFSRLGVSWETLEQLLEIHIEAPAVATRDPLQRAQVQEIQTRLGILSQRTAAAQSGLDYEAEQHHRSQEPQPPKSLAPIP